MQKRLTRLNTGAIRRDQLGSLRAELADLDLIGGNQNRILYDESGFSLQPATATTTMARGLMNVGFQRKNDELVLQDVLQTLEQEWGQPVTKMSLTRFDDGAVFAVRKAAQLARMGLTPDRVDDMFLNPTGSVRGVRMKGHRIFAQRFSPDPSLENGKVVVLGPGFAQTGRHFEAEVGKFLERGYNVMVYDQQWAGHSDGEKGSFDSIEGLAGSYAAVSAAAQHIVETEMGDHEEAEVIGVAISMGALAALTAHAANDNGDLQLEDFRMIVNDEIVDLAEPKAARGMKLLMQGPYLGMRSGLLNNSISWVANMMTNRRIVLPAENAPVIATKPRSKAINRQEAALEAIVSNPAALKKAADYLETFSAYVRDNPPRGRMSIYAQRSDRLADHDKTVQMKNLISERSPFEVTMHSEDGQEHVVENDAGAVETVTDQLDALAALAANKA